MFPARTFAKKKVAVFGLARSGISCALALQAGGATVFAWDDSEPAVEMARLAGVMISNLHQIDFSKIDSLVLSPGVPLTHPDPHWTVQKARVANVEIIGDTEVFAREVAGTGARLIAITGTNGKSTTTALINHMLTCAGLDVEMGGNIGKAVFNLEAPHPNKFYVIEVSSYQLDLSPSLKPDIAVLTNITPDHLDRHGSMENYAAVKAKIFAHMGKGYTALVGVDDPWTESIAGHVNSMVDVRRVSVARQLDNGISFSGNVMRDVRDGRLVDELSMRDMPSLLGTHNWQNAAIAYGVACALGVDIAKIGSAMRKFPGLAHRMQKIGVRDAVSFVNDSKATNADATEKALASFDNIHWIAGGIAKSGGIESLLPYANRIACTYLIGIAADDFAKTLEGKVAYQLCGTLEHALEAAARDAAKLKKTTVVLFSPACASFDQYKNFEIRGDAFVKLVSRLNGIHMIQENDI